MSAVVYPPAEVIRPTLGVVSRKFGRADRPLTVNTPALVIGDWAAHPTGKTHELVCDPDSQETYTFVEWAVSHVPTGYRPRELSLAWYHAVRLIALLDEIWPKGTATPHGKADSSSSGKENSAKFEAALAACQVEQSSEVRA